jgi:hypothetical protein
MRRTLRWAVLALVAIAGRCHAVSDIEQPRCTKSTFAHLLPCGGVIEKVDVVPAGGQYGEGPINKAFPRNATKLPALCAVTARFTNATTNFRFGLFLPANWTGKFLGIGSASFSGGINWPDLAHGPHYGMASVSTDHGHNSTRDALDWATPVTLNDW